MTQSNSSAPESAPDSRVRDWIERLADVPTSVRARKLQELARADRACADEVARRLGDVADGEGAGAVGQSLRPGDRVKDYVVLSYLGGGGFGDVYKAERRVPHQQTVALKVIKAGLDTREIVARFSSERQALARMDHPHIARILDGGSTDAGRSFFAMEFVPGQPIAQFADENRLDIDERLDLFQQVCSAIAHAHQKAILHRDIKSNNVLAYHRDGEHIVKVIDFGIAKALTGDRLTEQTFNTPSGAAIGAWTSMSPEQALGNGDIDTRSDVYSLGALLYELLAGCGPFDQESQRCVSDHELRDVICNRQPPTPSTQLTHLTKEQADRLSDRRKLKAEELRRTLRSELALIPLKALKKERGLRYQTVSELSKDIDNFRRGLPLIAAPDGWGYITGKYVWRYRAPLAAAAVFLLLLVGGLIGTSWGLKAARDAEAQARLAEAQARRAEAEAVAERDAARDAMGFVVSIVRASDPMEGDPNQTALVAVLETAAAELERSHAKLPPDIRLELHGLLGRSFHATGRMADACHHLQLALSAEAGRPLSPSRAELRWDYIRSLAELGEADQRAEQAALLVAEANELFGPDDPRTWFYTANTTAAGIDEVNDREAHFISIWARARGVEAEDLLSRWEEQVALIRAAELADDLESAASIIDGEIRPFLSGVELWDRGVAFAMIEVAGWLHQRGDKLAANAIYREAESLIREVSGDDSLYTGALMIERAGFQSSVGLLDEAETGLIEALQKGEGQVASNHVRRIKGLVILAEVYLQQGRYGDAQLVLSELDQIDKQFGNNLENTRAYDLRRAAIKVDLLHAAGKCDEAARLASSVLADVSPVDVAMPDMIAGLRRHAQRCRAEAESGAQAAA